MLSPEQVPAALCDRRLMLQRLICVGRACLAPSLLVNHNVAGELT